jgi:hypothetical protein
VVVQEEKERSLLLSILLLEAEGRLREPQDREAEDREAEDRE